MQYTKSPKPANKDVREGLRFIRQGIYIVITALFLAFISMAYILRAYQVDGQSMETTLHHGDRLIVWKAAKTWDNIRGKTYIPSRWDIVVFDRPQFTPNHSYSVDHLIKRAIALPGERVTIKEGVVTVYNQEHPDGFNPDAGQDYAKSFSKTTGEVDITVDEGEIFVLGDNRNNSLDSRRFGAIDVSHITGIAELRIAPVGSMRSF